MDQIWIKYKCQNLAQITTTTQAKGEKMPQDKTLKHLAIIMDGNGRWAQMQGKSRQVGHRKGAQNVRAITDWCAKHDISYLTLYAFSTENWNRPKKEVDFLMKLLEKYLRDEASTYHKNKIRFRAIGNIATFSQPLKSMILELESQTAHYTNLTQALALNYGGRNEIARAYAKIVGECVGGVDSGAESKNADFALSVVKMLDSDRDFKQMEALVQRHLDTADMPDVDLLVRTGGEQRLSNFLLWQASYAELAFSKTLWPDFGSDELAEIIEGFYQRQRRFGGL